tara:strand:+ start:346 stop:660 length:315 start_codon:yes stop_codon:yes gene_type:complete
VLLQQIPSHYTGNDLSGKCIDQADADEAHHCCTAISSKKDVGVTCVFHYQNTPGMICPVVLYAPMAAMTPNMAAQPLMRSALSFIVFLQSVVVNYYSAIFVSEY